MSGIFGVFNLDEGPVDRALVARMNSALAHRGPDDDSVTFDRSAALGCRLMRTTPESMSEAQPVVRASGTTLVFDGRLDNRDTLIAELRAHCDVADGTSDAELASWSYEIAGAEFARHLLGDFALAVFDPRTRCLVLARDAMGVRPLYYRNGPARVAFASEIKALLADPAFPARPNDQLLAELILRQTHRQTPDGSTLFSDVRHVPRGHVVVLTQARSRVHQYWDFDAHVSAAGASFDECAEEFRRLFRRAVERRLRAVHPTAIAVSGGLDSSAIFCAACEAASPNALVGLTYTTRDGSASDESAFVTEIERAYRRPIERIDTPLEGLLFRSAEIVRWTEAPMLDGQWFRGDRLMRAITRRHARTLLSGHWGDQLLFEQAYLIDLLFSGGWGTMRRHLHEYSKWFPDAAGDEFRKQLRADLLEYGLPRWLRDVLRRARRSWTSAPPWDSWYCERFRAAARRDVFTYTPTWQGATAQATALYREVRSQYHEFCLEWNNKMGAAYGVEPAFPFLDRDLVQFLMCLPGELLVRDGVPKAILRRAFDGIVPRAILTRRTKADFTGDVNRAARQDHPALMTMLGRDPHVVELGYIDGDRLKRGLVAAGPALQRSGSSVVSCRVAAVVALELWLREFIGSRRASRKDT